MRFLMIIVMICGALLPSSPALAQNIPTSQIFEHNEHIDLIVEGKGVALRVDRLETIFDPSYDIFLKKAEDRVRFWTAATRFEVCGMMCRSSKGFSVTILTANSHLGCPVLNHCPEGFEPFDDQRDIHSHGTKGRFRINWSDWWLTGEPVGSWSNGSANKNHFSPEDLRGPAAYLVTPKSLLFHPGQSKEKMPPLDLLIRPNGMVCRS